MAQVKVNINGNDYTADDSKTILQVVRENKIDDIPTLCYEERLGHITSCFLCVVEVEGARGLVPSCSTNIRDGMIIKTKTDKVISARKTCLELLFSDHYADCISPCAQKCPAGVDIQGYLNLVKKGLYREAVELIKEKNPLPIVCGRVCVRECEVGCRRNLLDEPVGIDYLKRYAAESREGRSFKPKVKPPVGKSVGIAGGGPAGLSAAYYLAIEGYNVTVYEGMPKAGGMLRYGIPAYRLPRDLIDIEIDSIKNLGVEIKCNQQMGRDFTLTDLKEKHDAVLLALGAWKASGMRAENEDAEGVLSGIELLREVTEGKVSELRGRVLVIGGGNTAIDASRTSVRLGADETVILYRRTETQMPAHQEEIDAAKHEGVNMKFLVSPVKVITNKEGRATGLECIKMKLGEADSSGRPRPVKIEGSNYVEPCDYIIAAIGQKPRLKCLDGGNGECSIELTRWGSILVDEKNMETSIPGVFSAGDVVTGAATVIEGIGAGRKSAYAIHNHLTGDNVKVDTKEFLVSKDMFAPVTCDDVSCFECAARHAMPERNAAERVKDFREVELGLSREDTIDEAGRCFQCGCLEVDECLLRKYGDDYGIEPTHYLGEVNRYETDKRHPLMIIDPNKCIQCGRCIKTCSNILEASALGFVNRGFKTIIAPAMEKPLLETNCIACGNCIDTCPTGALSENQTLLARIGDKVKDNPAVCSFCSVGCEINVKAFGRDMRIRSLRDKFTGYGDYLCRRGRFGSRYLNSTDRILQPAVRQDGRIHYTEWDRALSETAKRFDEIRKRYGNDSIAVFISPKLTNEEIYSAVRLARSVMGTDIVGSFGDIFYGRDRHEIDHILGHTVSTNSMEEVIDADVILLVNADPVKTHPSFSWRIREAIRNGTKVIVVNSNRIDLVRHAHLWLQPRRGTATHVINAVMNEIIKKGNVNEEFIGEKTIGFETFKNFIKDFEADEVAYTAGVIPDKMRKAAELISQGNPKVMVVYDEDSSIDRSVGDMSAIADLLLLTGNFGKKSRGLLLLQKHSNSMGLYDNGAEPGFLPGRQPIENEEARSMFEKAWGVKLPEKSTVRNNDIEEIFLSGKVKAALIIGEDPLENPGERKRFRGMEFVAVMDLFMTETAQSADVILPASTYIESGGSFTGFDRKIRKFPSAFPAPAGKTNLQILNELAKLMGTEIKDMKPEEVFEEIRKLNRLYATVNLDSEKEGRHYWTCDTRTCKNCGCKYIFCSDFATEDGKARFAAYRVETGTYPSREFSHNAIEHRYKEWIRKLFVKGGKVPVAVE